MRTISRRELAHNLAKTLDEVAATEEAVEISTRGGKTLMISVKPETEWEQWVREGLVSDEPHDIEVLADLEPVAVTSTVEEILAHPER